MKKLFLLDAYALIYRAYYGLIRTPRITSAGLNTSAIFGFVNTLDDVLRKEQPTHLAVCFDPVGGHTFRHEMFADYKAGRDKQPEDITLSIPYIKRILGAMHIPVVEIPTYEADDVIGTLSHRAEEQGFLTYMMTPDKDYGQLVTDRVLMYRPATKGQGFEVRGPQQVCERYGIQNPLQVIDLLALEGDASDNIPGCPGVGEKTAVKLINEFGSVEQLLASTASLKGALKLKVEANREQIVMSKDLATIRTDIPLEVGPDDFVRQAPDVEALKAIYQELEFKSFVLRLNDSAATPPSAAAPAAAPAPSAAAPAAAPAPSAEPSLFDFAEPQAAETGATLESSDADYSSATIDDLIAEARRSKLVGLATYAVGPEAMTARWMGVALSSARGRAAYTEVDPFGSTAGQLQELFADESVTIVSHDVKRDMLLLRRNGVEWNARWFDTSVAHYLLQPEQRHNLADVARWCLNYQTVDYDTAATRVKKQEAVDAQLAPTLFCEYADLTLRLHDELRQRLHSEGIQQELLTLEQDLVKVLADMEWVGVRIDCNILGELSTRLSARAEAMEQEVYAIAGHSFNIGSPSQVGQVLFGELQIDTKVKRTKSGNFSTTEEVLEKHRHTHRIVDLILQIRGLRKLLATYINALPGLINPTTGKIHTTYNQTVTATGRLSSNNPNLQNIPVRSDDGREVRRAFVPDPGCVMLSADYSQIELRLMADISGDPDMIEAFAEGKDIHQATAAKIYHKPLDEVTDTERRNAKTANFGIIYGISAFGLSERLGISRQEARQLIDGYFLTYPRIKQYMEETVERARRDGYVTTVMGRRRMLPDINSRSAVVRGYAERNAINAPLQGSAADIIKVAMVRIHRAMRQASLRSTMLLQVHDELIFNVVPDELPRLQQIVVTEMEGAYHGRVTLTVSAGVASNWLNAH
jgi:DNA polymerase-1